MKIINILIVIVLALPVSVLAQETYFLNTEVVAKYDGAIPQAPRISPDGQKLLYERYIKGTSEIILCDADGQNKIHLSGNKGLPQKVENAFWHPSQKFVVFNELPDGSMKTGAIYLGELKGNALGQVYEVEKGARAQFSKPNGTVLFFESTEKKVDWKQGGAQFNNTIKYRILGSDPMNPSDNTTLLLRGPIQSVARNVELSHPSLAPDGTTIFFAARTAVSGENLRGLYLSDGERQRAVVLWKEIAEKNNNGLTVDDLQTELKNITGSEEYEIDQPFVIVGKEDEFEKIKSSISGLKGKPTIIEGYDQRDFLHAWLLGFLAKLDMSNQGEFEYLAYSRVWKTDIFGADVSPLVPSYEKVPLPQKWTTASRSGRFAILEAGHYRNRHLYAVSLESGKTIKLTDKGTYNSSPEISQDEQWVYFESNRRGAKDIWRARLDLEKVMAALQ